MLSALNQSNLTYATAVDYHGETASDGYNRDTSAPLTIETDPTVNGAEVISPILSKHLRLLVDVEDRVRQHQVRWRHLWSKGRVPRHDVRARLRRLAGADDAVAQRVAPLRERSGDDVVRSGRSLRPW